MNFIEKDLQDLNKAFALLNQKTITEKMTQVIGKPVDYLVKALPDGIEEQIHSLLETAFHKATDAALYSLDNEPNREASTKTNKFLAACSGAVGGAFGFSALMIELPFSTTIMLRSVADIARSEGFDLDCLETKQACLEVFALGSPSEDDDSAETAYYSVRLFTAETMRGLSKDLAEIVVQKSAEKVTNNIAPTQASKWLANLIDKVATRFGIVITEKGAAQSIPLIGAVIGATLNTMFTDYYQDMARGHFIIRRLEHKYGFDMVKKEYSKISNLTKTKLNSA